MDAKADPTEPSPSFRQLDHFLAVCSHDIRSPLISMVAGCRLLLKGRLGELSPKQREIVENSQLSAQNVLDLTTSLLDLARLENGAEHLVLEVLDLNATVRQACESHRLAAEQKGLEIRLSLPLRTVTVEGDRLKLLRICNNLISNAVKYSAPATEVLVTVTVDATHAEIGVTDHGPGISREDQVILFDRFSQLARAKRTRDEGTGLGLAITLGLIRLHQGQIVVESELGRGSTFRARLPVLHPRSSPGCICFNS